MLTLLLLIGATCIFVLFSSTPRSWRIAYSTPAQQKVPLQQRLLNRNCSGTNPIKTGNVNLIGLFIPLELGVILTIYARNYLCAYR